MKFSREKIVGGVGVTAGIGSSIGSVANACHSLCTAVMSSLAAAGITLNILPFMFLQTYQLYFWIAAAIMTAAMIGWYALHPMASQRAFLFLNGGLLLFSLPFPVLADYLDLFRFLGAVSALFGLALLLFGSRRFLVRLAAIRLDVSRLLFSFVILTFIVNQIFLQVVVAGPKEGGDAELSSLKLTAFDIALAKEHMDADGDGVCDACGMPVEQCIESGQVDCNMSGDKGAMGILGSAHTHADIKIYVNGEALNLTNVKNYMVSSMLHLDNQTDKEDAGSTLHMHATNVPLSVFFQSIGMELAEDHLTLQDGRILKNENGNTLKFFVNGERMESIENFAFADLDKILVSYGSENDTEIANQLRSIPDFSSMH